MGDQFVEAIATSIAPTATAADAGPDRSPLGVPEGVLEVTDDLSTRLLEEIAAKERAVKRVMEGAWWLNDYIDEAGQAWLDEWANEALALRLCQAHREIVEALEVAKAQVSLLLERRADGAAVLEAQGVVQGLDLAVQSLALAYDLDTPREGE